VVLASDLCTLISDKYKSVSSKFLANFEQDPHRFRINKASDYQFVVDKGFILKKGHIGEHVHFYSEKSPIVKVNILKSAEERKLEKRNPENDRIEFFEGVLCFGIDKVIAQYKDLRLLNLKGF